jgi:hypothetical protein
MAKQVTEWRFEGAEWEAREREPTRREMRLAAAGQELDCRIDDCGTFGVMAIDAAS